jgi:mono/diheme cytochrome c family protein
MENEMNKLLVQGLVIATASLLVISCGGDKAKTEKPAAKAKATEHHGHDHSSVDVAAAKTLMTAKTCFVCHTVDGSDTINGAKALGPTLKGLYGKHETVTTGGTDREIKVDDAYLIKSMKEPMADITKGFAPAMVIPPITDDEIHTIIEYIKTLH